MSVSFRQAAATGVWFGVVVALALAYGGGQAIAAGASRGADYREPSAAVAELLTAPPPPEPMLHVRSGRVALLYRASRGRTSLLGA